MNYRTAEAINRRLLGPIEAGTRVAKIKQGQSPIGSWVRRGWIKEGGRGQYLLTEDGADQIKEVSGVE